MNPEKMLNLIKEIMSDGFVFTGLVTQNGDLRIDSVNRIIPQSKEEELDGFKRV